MTLFCFFRSDHILNRPLFLCRADSVKRYWGDVEYVSKSIELSNKMTNGILWVYNNGTSADGYYYNKRLSLRQRAYFKQYFKAMELLL